MSPRVLTDIGIIHHPERRGNSIERIPKLPGVTPIYLGTVAPLSTKRRLFSKKPPLHDIQALLSGKSDAGKPVFPIHPDALPRIDEQAMADFLVSALGMNLRNGGVPILLDALVASGRYYETPLGSELRFRVGGKETPFQRGNLIGTRWVVISTGEHAGSNLQVNHERGSPFSADSGSYGVLMARLSTAKFVRDGATVFVSPGDGNSLEHVILPSNSNRVTYMDYIGPLCLKLWFTAKNSNVHREFVFGFPYDKPLVVLGYTSTEAKH